MAERTHIKYGKLCAVPQCMTRSTANCTLHQFPFHSPALCHQWKNVLKISKTITSETMVCSRHFMEDDFFPASAKASQRHLKKAAVPTQNLPGTKQDIVQSSMHRTTRKYQSQPQIEEDTELSDSELSIEEKSLDDAVKEEVEEDAEGHLSDSSKSTATASETKEEILELIKDGAIDMEEISRDILPYYRNKEWLYNVIGENRLGNRENISSYQESFENNTVQNLSKTINRQRTQIMDLQFMVQTMKEKLKDRNEQIKEIINLKKTVDYQKRYIGQLEKELQTLKMNSKGLPKIQPKNEEIITIRLSYEN